ncbi:MAG: hypothetical protein E6K53_13080 [Gammaproteobacteria bacterium]|nr:MAG: hypothetical protein E6K53_13080 [Gammaproteobacteria bacterium]
MREPETPLIHTRVALKDGYYVLFKHGEFVAFEQERGIRFNEAKFQLQTEAGEYIAGLSRRANVPQTRS